MTRQEFINDITEWTDLHNFMREIDYYDDCEDFYDMDGYSDAIYEDISNMEGASWYDLRDGLDELPSEDYDSVYIRSGWLDYRIASEAEFAQYKQSVLDYADDGEYWDEPEEDELTDEFFEDIEEDDELEIEEDFDISSFSASCVQVSKNALSTARIEDEIPLAF